MPSYQFSEGWLLLLYLANIEALDVVCNSTDKVSKPADKVSSLRAPASATRCPNECSTDQMEQLDWSGWYNHGIQMWPFAKISVVRSNT